MCKAALMTCWTLRRHAWRLAITRRACITSSNLKSTFPRELPNMTLGSIKARKSISRISSTRVGWFKTRQIAIICMPRRWMARLNGVIKKHELTRRDKEEDRMKHVRVNNANIEPVFFAYPDNEVLDRIIKRYAAMPPEYDFVAKEDHFRHQFWIVDKQEDILAITKEFEKMPSLYIADGHHRSAAAALVGAEKAKLNPNHTGTEEYNYFMAVCFQASQLTILDYNRVVKDLNGLDSSQFLDRLKENFDVEDKGENVYKPGRLHEFSLYLDGHWYSLTAHPGTYDEADPIGVLDVDISSRLILNDILGITDLRSDKRIDFVGGLRGLEELKRRVDSGEMRMALALYPVTMKQIMDIADSGKIMPPKATWFEPKLRSGLVIHSLE